MFTVMHQLVSVFTSQVTVVEKTLVNPDKFTVLNLSTDQCDWSGDHSAAQYLCHSYCIVHKEQVEHMVRRDNAQVWGGLGGV